MIVPDYLPHPRLLVFISGFVEILAGSGLIAAKSRRWAGICLIALLIAVFPANINMAIKAPNTGSVIDWLLWLRLPLQPVLGCVIWRLAVASQKRRDE